MRINILFVLLFFLTPTRAGAQIMAIDTLLSQPMSIRALAIENDLVWYAADKGRVGCFDLQTRRHREITITKDTLQLEFRSIGQTPTDILVLSIGNPALLYKISKTTFEYELVYSETHEKVFYDAMQFTSARDGVAMGDPTGNCFSIIETRDGGASWKKRSCSGLPKIAEGEAAFAASNTNIVTKGNDCWLVSGGQRARVFHSSDGGRRWRAFETPITQGSPMQGIFTADFYDTQTGFIAGGDYEHPHNNTGNKAVTKDGGQSWRLVADGLGFGYVSCIQYAPHGKGMDLAAAGPDGIWQSRDGGHSWLQIAAAKNIYTFRFVGSKTMIAAGRNVLLHVVLEE